MLDYSYEYLNGVKIPGCLPSSLLSSNKGIARNFRQTKTRDLGFTEEKWNWAQIWTIYSVEQVQQSGFPPQNEALFVAAGAAFKYI